MHDPCPRHTERPAALSGGAVALESGRVRLLPLRARDAAELAPLLDDPELHRYTGGQPPSLPTLEERFRRLEEGAPPSSGEAWLNWVIRRTDGRAVGTVQATVRPAEAEVAWVVGRPWQGRGYAREAAQALVRWLQDELGLPVVARIHPEHRASEGVARAAGLLLTEEWSEDERVWRSA